MLLHNSLCHTIGRSGITPRDLLIEAFPVSDRIYVDLSGSDTSGDGTQNAPYATLDYATAQAITGKAIIIGGGEFQVSRKANYYNSHCLFDTTSNGITYIGTPGKTRISASGTDSGGRDFHLFNTGAKETHFYYLHFKRDNNGRTTDYTVAVHGYHSPGGAGSGRASHCVFEELNANGNMSSGYSASGMDWVFDRCSFVASNMLPAYSYAASQTIIKNSAFTSTAQAGSHVSSVNNLGDVVMGSDHKIITGHNQSFDYFRLQVDEKNGTYTQIDDMRFIAQAISYPIQDMTSNTAPAPYIVDRSNIHNATYEAYKAFDNSPTATGWSGSSAANPWISLSLGSGNDIKLDQFNITSLSGLDWQPKAFSIYGSTDGGTTLTPIMQASGQTDLWGSSQQEFTVTGEDIYGIHSGFYGQNLPLQAVQPGIYVASGAFVDTGGFADGDRTGLVSVTGNYIQLNQSGWNPPLENIINGSTGPRWFALMAGWTDTNVSLEFEFDEPVALLTCTTTGSGTTPSRGFWKWQCKDAEGTWHDASTSQEWLHATDMTLNDDQISGVDGWASRHWRLKGVSSISAAGGYYIYQFNFTYKEIG